MGLGLSSCRKLRYFLRYRLQSSKKDGGRAVFVWEAASCLEHPGNNAAPFLALGYFEVSPSSF